MPEEVVGMLGTGGWGRVVVGLPDTNFVAGIPHVSNRLVYYSEPSRSGVLHCRMTLRERKSAEELHILSTEFDRPPNLAALEIWEFALHGPDPF